MTTQNYNAPETERQNSFSLWRPVNFDNLQRPEPRVAVVPGLLYRETVVIPYGRPAGMKSFVLADLAVCTAAGISWLYPEPGNGAAVALCEYPTVQGPVVWVDFDNGNYTTRERFYALRTAYHLGGGFFQSRHIPLSFYTMPAPWLDLSNADHTADFALWLAGLPETPVMVVIDNLSYVSGSLSTNDDGMKNVLAALKHAAELSGALVLAIHHERKSNGVNARVGEKMRGSSAIEAGCDLALLFERDGDDPTITIRATKNRILHSSPKIGLKLMTAAGADGVLEQARCYQIPVAEDNDAEGVRHEVLAILAERGNVHKTDLAKLAGARAGVGINKARGILGGMIAAGDVLAVTDNDARGKPFVCSLP